MKKILLFFSILLVFSVKSQIHFQESFENGIPGTWSSYIGTNGLGTLANWEIIDPGLLSDSSAYVDFEGGTGGVNEDWLVTPLITLGSGSNNLRFFQLQDYSSDYGTTYEIKVSTTSQTSHASFTTIASYGESSFSNSSWLLKNIDLSSYSGQSVYIAFVMSQDDGDSWYIDSVVVETPTCPIPSNLNADNITATSATLKWNGIDTNYQIAYYPYSTANSPIFAITTDSNYSLTGLNSNTTIEYYVREICSPGDTSFWSNAYSFNTLCTSPTIPYIENFDLDTFGILPCNWVRENNNSDGNQWAILTDPDALSPTKVMFIDYNPVFDMDDWLITPEFYLTNGILYSISFSYKTSSFTEDFDITYGLYQNSFYQTNLIQSFTGISTDDNWVDTTLVFSPSFAGDYSIGIHGKSLADEDYIAIDNFSISYISSIEENLQETNFSIFPNPTNGLFTITKINNNNSYISITDVNGKVVKTLNNPSFTEKIDLSEVTKGVYFVTLSTNNTITTKKLIIQ